MNNHPLPPRCAVLVVGAGPAGSACAIWLARAGMDVVLIDAQAFPRDKVCGDALIPDAHNALQRLGAYDEVMACAHGVGHVACTGPRGGRVDVPGRLAVLPRRELDQILARIAVRAGARMFAPARFEAALTEGGEQGRVVGARIRLGAVVHELRAGHVVLATGAQPQALIAAGLCERRAPSAVAMRGYLRNRAMAGRIQALEIVWHRRLRLGYGWIFPVRDDVFNIGVGLAQGRGGSGAQRPGRPDANLHELFAAFTQVHAPLRELIAGGQWLDAFKGAPLRCSLAGARYSRPGMLVTGEAAGSTYAFTGEGIGKGMETGILAAQALLDAHAGDDHALCLRYEAALAALKPRFDLYERANRIYENPWLADLLIWRANKSARIRARMAGVLEETGNPGNLVTARGIARLFLPLS